jgi:hypothetical protein
MASEERMLQIRIDECQSCKLRPRNEEPHLRGDSLAKEGPGGGEAAAGSALTPGRRPSASAAQIAGARYGVGPVQAVALTPFVESFGSAHGSGT